MISPDKKPQRTIFLTGGSGVIGQALIKKMDARSVICLVRQTPVSHPNAMTVKGDISLPRFGLSAERWREVAARTDCILHSAAVTDFHKPDDKVMKANVNSLEN